MKRIYIFIAVLAIGLLLPIYTLADSPKILSVYYMNWSPHSHLNQHQQVRDLPWNRVSVINHAFWRLVPNEDQTQFSIASIEPHLDLRPGGAFDQYAEMHALYPDVRILLSIGGWADSRWFTIMASTPEGRQSFINATIETLLEFPFFGGVNINWEHPGSSREHEGIIPHPNEMDNYTALLRELRMGFDAAGLVEHQLTIAAPSSTNCLRNGTITIDIPAIWPYLCQISIMTYDMAGGWTGRAMHHTALNPGRGVESGISVAEAVEFYLSQGVPPELLSIGSPLYTHGWIIDAENGEDALGMMASGQPASPLGAGQRHWHDIQRLKQYPGWEVLHDEAAEAAFIFNSDPTSPNFQHFYTYESTRSLQAKLDFINEMGLGGLIVWATAGDAMYPLADFPMITQMAVGLGLYSGEIPVFPMVFAPQEPEEIDLLPSHDYVPSYDDTEYELLPIEEDITVPLLTANPRRTIILLIAAAVLMIVVGGAFGAVVALSKRR